VERKAGMRYSEAFELQVTREFEQGRFEGAVAAGRANGVKGNGTVANRVRRYGKDHSLGKLFGGDASRRTNGSEDIAQARKSCEQDVWLYNHRRPHLGLNHRFPAEVHEQAA